MRDLPEIRARWVQSNGVFLGDNKPDGRITVEPDWTLNLTGPSYGSLDNGPYRWFLYGDQSQVEIDVPNLKSIAISRSIDQDAGTCTVTIYNQWMDTTGATPESPASLGNPGYLGPTYGSNPETSSLFGQSQNSWFNVLRPNALIRTYQGYGSYTNGVPDDRATAVADGTLAQTGIWLIDRVSTGTNGMITLTCRDAAKLLIEQRIMPPLYPNELAGLKYCTFVTENIPGTAGSPGIPAVEAVTQTTGEPVGVRYLDSSMATWGYEDTLHGYNNDAVADGDNTTASWSQGVDNPDAIYARAFWEVEVNAEINEIFINPAHSSFGNVWVSIMVNGEWVGANDVPWDDNDNDGYSDSLATGQPGSQPVRPPGIDIPYAVQTSVGNGGAWVPLPSRTEATLPTSPGGATSVTSDVWDVQRIRITTNQSWNSGVGPFPYRAVLQSIDARLTTEVENPDGSGGAIPAVPEVPATAAYSVQRLGNVTDYTNIVEELLLWSGFLEYGGASPAGETEALGILEMSGSWPVECINEDFFDKKSPMDAINGIKDILGFIFFIDEEGGCRFHTPNWWTSGNLMDDGSYAPNYIPELYDEANLTSYQSDWSDDFVRSEIVVGSTLPGDGVNNTQYARIPGGDQTLMRGMVKPAIWINEVWQEPIEQLFTAALIDLHISFQSRKGSVTASCNPEFQINDQVRITERITSESYIHYIRGISTSMDLDTGEYLMTLTTNWLGAEDQWAFDRESILALYPEEAYRIRTFVGQFITIEGPISGPQAPIGASAGIAPIAPFSPVGTSANIAPDYIPQTPPIGDPAFGSGN